MKLSIKVAATSVSINVFIQDSSSATGAGLTGLVWNSAGLTVYYAFPRSAPVAITLATLAAVTSAFSSGGFIEISATNMPGWYRLDVPDDVLGSGFRFVNLHIKGAANMAPLPIEIELTGWDNQAGTVVSVSGAVGSVTGAVGSVTAGVTLAASAVQAIWDAATSALTAAGSIGKKLADWVVGTIDTYTGNTKQTGDAFARLGAPAGASVSADVAAIKAKTDNLPASPAAVGSAMTLTAGERDSIADAHLDRANGIETGLTPRQAHRLEAAAAAGKISGAATTTVTIRNAVADTKDRLIATVDSSGNRSAVTADVT